MFEIEKAKEQSLVFLPPNSRNGVKLHSVVNLRVELKFNTLHVDLHLFNNMGRPAGELLAGDYKINTVSKPDVSSLNSNPCVSMYFLTNCANQTFSFLIENTEIKNI